jgi:hypothetical protein
MGVDPVELRVERDRDGGSDLGRQRGSDDEDDRGAALALAPSPRR